MATVYLDHSGLELRPDGEALALYENGARLRSLPLKLLDRVVVQGDLALSASVLTRIVDAGASVVFLSKRQSRRVATVLGHPHQDARIRLAQFAAAHDPAFRARLAAGLVRIKIREQRRVLAEALERRPDERKALTDALRTRDPGNGVITRFGQASGTTMGLRILFGESMKVTPSTPCWRLLMC